MLVIAVFVAVVCAIASAVIAQSKNNPVGQYAFVGLILGPIGLLIAAVAKPTPQAVSAPPGWLPDPSGQPGLRYWDGQRWTEHTHGSAPATPAEVAQQPDVEHQQ
jgi:hypothetical protein